MGLRVISVLTCLFVLSCGKKNTAIKLNSTELLSPMKNSACTDALPISDEISSVEFKWGAVDKADRYELTVRDQSGANVVVSATELQILRVELKRNVTYSWFVKATTTNGNGNSESQVWKFHNPGPGASSFAPFPAEAISPYNGQLVKAENGKIELSWRGVDPDDDIKSYDVYMGTSTQLLLVSTAIVEPALRNVTVTPATTYYWKVVSKDKSNNTAESSVFQFAVK